MPHEQRNVNWYPIVPMTVASLMNRPLTDHRNYEAEVLPLVRLYGTYKNAFVEALKTRPGNMYAVANFNLRDVEPAWCRNKLNVFDMKLARCLLGGNWCKRPNADRPQWIAVPERATFLHYNMVWDVPIALQHKFFIEAPWIWRRMVPSGQFYLQVIGEEAGEDLATRIYCGKTFHPGWTIDNTILSTEFRRKKT